MVGFRLGNTLSESGTVSRGVCRVQGGRLVSITEERSIARADVGPGRRFAGDEITSMNCWGFTPALFGGLDEGLKDFLAASGSDPKAEYYLPAAVSGLVAEGAATVDVIPSGDSWFKSESFSTSARRSRAKVGCMKSFRWGSGATSMI
jgi:hypothetical protein